MPEMICIARAYNDEPLVRNIVGVYRKLVYIAKLSPQSANGIEGKGAVGFHQQFVFKYEKSLFDRLYAAFKAGDANQLGALWGQATLIPKSSLDTFLKTGT